MELPAPVPSQWPCVPFQAQQEKGRRRRRAACSASGWITWLGEDTDIENEPGTFNSASVWGRISVVAAGPVFNFIMAFVLSVIIVGAVGYEPSRVLSVKEGSAAEAAGLKEGDIITGYQGYHIDLGKDLYVYSYLNQLKEGDTINLTVKRDGKKMDISYKSDTNVRYLLGCNFNGDDTSAMPVESVMDGMPLQEAGIQQGDVITSINGVKITNAAEDVSNEALEETTDETADEIADEPEEEVTEESLDEVEEEAAEESVDEAAEETADEAVEEPADEVAEETAEGAADEQKMATDENISNASYVGRTVEITPDSKKAAENDKSDFALKEDSKQVNVSDTENDADEDALKNQLQRAIDGFVNEGNKPSETVAGSLEDDNEDDSEDDDLQFIDLN